jgi:putative FmdB family regulatory protein
MPIYEYRCPEHGVFEKLEKAQKNDTQCPKCKEVSKRVMSTPGKFVWGKSGAWNK